ncbi:hypothetical protein G9A89_011160 [Geosiphon pyriformis]|nr:hypothetical protein G9A89_011160 [Geosiphon pyriformis]
MTTIRARSKKGLSVIEAARQNVLATFPLKNISEKLSLVASGLFFSPLAGNSSPVKVPLKRHTWVSPSIVSTTSKSPKIFNNRPVNKLVFPALTTPTTTSTTTASQMATKAKNSKKQQQAVTTAMVTLNSFVVPDEILGKISTVAASPLPDMDGNSNSSSPNMKQDQPLAVLPDVMEMESFTPLPVSGVANGSTWMNIAQFSGVAFVSSPPLSVALHNVPLGTFFIDIKSALSIFGVVTSVKLKSAGLWQYAVLVAVPVSFLALQRQCFAVVTFDFLESLKIAVSKTGILCGCRIWWETPRCHHCYRCQGLDHLALECKVSPPPLPKVSSNFSGGSKVFKSSFAGSKSSFAESKSYAKAAAIVVPPVAAAANLDLGARLASLESHLGKLSLLIKSLVEPVGALVALVTKLLFTSLAINASVKECVDGLAKQNKGLGAVATVMQKRITCLEKICEWVCLEDESDVDDMVDDVDNDDNDDDKDFSVYDNTFDVMMHLWEDQPSKIKSSPD